MTGVTRGDGTERGGEGKERRKFLDKLVRGMTFDELRRRIYLGEPRVMENPIILDHLSRCWASHLLLESGYAFTHTIKKSLLRRLFSSLLMFNNEAEVW